MGLAYGGYGYYAPYPYYGCAYDPYYPYPYAYPRVYPYGYVRAWVS